MNAGGDTGQAKTSFTVTEDHSAREIEAAMSRVKKFFRAEYTGCTLTELWYEGESMSAEEEDWSARYNGREAIVLLSTFQTDDSGRTVSLEPDTVYSNYKWVLVKNALGGWSLKTWGYV
ncbi:MAG: hypothetical protein LUE21_09605 [Oscillospiraceae bacterium]|nr:hypothetical protein [Oscillospiraceae bacterium]